MSRDEAGPGAAADAGPVARAARLLPGLGVLAAFAVAAQLAAPAGIEPLVVAVASGAVVANTVGMPRWAAPGIGLGSLLLETGIVLLGARLAVGELLAAGPLVLALVVAAVLAALLVVESVGRRAATSDRATSLLAAGAGICGVSAVVAVAGAIDADAEDVTYAAATILLFDAVTLVAFPALGDLLALSSQQFGVWAGLAMFSTGPVAAAGFAYSTAAGQWATVTKLARNSLIGLVAVGYSLRYAHAEAGGDADGRRMDTLATLWSRFPKFLVGFLVVAAVANAGLLSAGTLASLASVSDWLFALAFVALGFDIRLDAMRATGLAPVALVAVSLAVVGTLSLAAVILVL